MRSWVTAKNVGDVFFWDTLYYFCFILVRKNDKAYKIQLSNCFLLICAVQLIIPLIDCIFQGSATIMSFVSAGWVRSMHRSASRAAHYVVWQSGLSVCLSITLATKTAKQIELNFGKKTLVTLLVPHVLTAVGQRSFAVNGPTTWNSLPPALRAPELWQNTFTRALKIHYRLFSTARHRWDAEYKCLLAYLLSHHNVHHNYCK